MTWIAAYAGVGAVIGFLAGLLGIGGGMTLVPVLASLFAAQGLSPEHGVHLALGTAMASVMFTATSSVRAHQQHGGVDWRIVRGMAPGMVVGALLSTSVSGWVPQRVLAMAFAVIVFGGATQILLGRKPSRARAMPAAVPQLAWGLIIGAICGVVSAGGAFLTLPFMLFCGVTMHTAIGTAAALGIPVAVVGAAGFIFSGAHAGAMPPWSLGFVYLPALVPLVLASVLTAPWGARMAHRSPTATLKRVFAVLLYALAAKMLWTYW